MTRVRRTARLLLTHQFMEAGPHDHIAAPADEDIAVSLAGCHGTAT